jgi:hypothetical protein
MQHNPLKRRPIRIRLNTADGRKKIYWDLILKSSLTIISTEHSPALRDDRYCADAGNDDTLGALSWPASKKRQGTKSREIWHPAVQRVLLGSYVGGDLDGGRGASTRRRACAHAGEPGRVQWTSRRAYGIRQRAVGGLMGGIGSRGGKPHGRMLPQLSRSGMNVAQ